MALTTVFENSRDLTKARPRLLALLVPTSSVFPPGPTPHRCGQPAQSLFTPLTGLPSQPGFFLSFLPACNYFGYNSVHLLQRTAHKWWEQLKKTGQSKRDEGWGRRRVRDKAERLSKLQRLQRLMPAFLRPSRSVTATGMWKRSVDAALHQRNRLPPLPAALHVPRDYSHGHAALPGLLLLLHPSLRALSSGIWAHQGYLKPQPWPFQPALSPHRPKSRQNPPAFALVPRRSRRLRFAAGAGRSPQPCSQSSLSPFWETASTQTKFNEISGGPWVARYVFPREGSLSLKGAFNALQGVLEDGGERRVLGWSDHPPPPPRRGEVLCPRCAGRVVPRGEGRAGG